MKFPKQYFKDVFRTTSIMTFSIILSISFIVTFAAITWPTQTPTGENQGGLFMNYFNSMLVNPNDPSDGTVKKATKASKLIPIDNDDIASKFYVNNQVDAAGSYVKGAHYGGCTTQVDGSFNINTAASAAKYSLVRPMLSCGNKGQAYDPSIIVCDTGFTPLGLAGTQMNAGGSYIYWGTYVCVKN